MRRFTRVPRQLGPSPRRRWCIPPALLYEPDEMLEGVGVLDEVAGPVGLLLWQSMRDVMLWAGAEPEDRAGLFTSVAAHVRLGEVLASGADPSLEVSLTSLAAMVGSPESANPEILSLVCVEVSHWAERCGAFAAAMGFAQAAALVQPFDAEPAVAAGMLALRWHRAARAETWLRRAVGLARRGRQWDSYAQAYVELGRLYARNGQAATAERYFVQGLRAARRHGLIMVRGSALHGLLLLALEGGDLDDAERYARGAMRAYGRGHPRLPVLVHDVAYLWVRRENYARAIPMLQKLLPSRVQPVERALTLAILARAGAGAADSRLYQESWMDAWAVINRHPDEVGRHARALLELAHGSAIARDGSHVEQAVRLALNYASPADRSLVSQLEEIKLLARG